MAMIEYEFIEGVVELRDTPLGEQLRHWDPLPRREWLTMVSNVGPFNPFGP